MQNYSSTRQIRYKRLSLVLFVGITTFICGYFISHTLLHSKYADVIHNSTDIPSNNQPATDTNNTNSILTNSAPTPQSTKDSQSYSILFLGDMMFDRGVATNIQKRGAEYVFASGTRALTEDYDLVVANLEGPITTYSSKTIDATGKAIQGFSFTFPTSTATLLAEGGIDIVSLANNHSDNFGREGLKQTIQYLDQANVKYFGNPTNSAFDIASTSYKYCPDVHEKCIAFIGYHQFAYKNESIILDEIKKYEIDPSVSFIVLFPHWGEEYKKLPNQAQKSLAHAWIDAGADLIIGAHPHVVQTHEMYKGKNIYYSLGNYIFDQYFSYDTTHGIVVGIILDKTLSTIEATKIIPVDITGTVVRRANEIDTKKNLRDFQ
jgi:gamma-polyglutamate biosynthesis protein CapA